MFRSNPLLKLFLGAFLALPLAACVSTKTPEVADKQKPTPEEVKKVTSKLDDEVVCKRVKVTGTNFKKKVCLTRAERRAMREEARKLLENAQSSTAGPDYKGN
ncbi:MAG: hypothetical protein OQJ89_16840 [Kangiellaceae bacterium]|nr:hypothetical protein [Kangiellaceae bacterium]MCW9018643.1 hypothetical protein [Kangiellaceae bacterium]